VLVPDYLAIRGKARERTHNVIEECRPKMEAVADEIA
jgi:hypothetical protein